MRIRILLFSICALLIIPVSSEAQVTNYLKKKANRAVKTAGKTADKEVDKEIDKQVTKGVLNLKDKLMGKEGNDSTAATVGNVTDQQAGNQATVTDQEDTGNAGQIQQQQEQQQAAGLGALSSIMGGGGGDVEHKGSYDFNLSINMDMEVFDDGSENVSTRIEYITYVNTRGTDVAIEIHPESEGGVYQGNMTMIYDQQNNSVFMLSDQGGQKMAIATSMDDMPDSADNGTTASHVSDNPTYTKTGRTKTIQGYKCEEYSLQDAENRVNMWVTDDIDFDPGRKQMKKAGIPMYYEGPFEGGMIMEMEVYENDVKQMRMFVKEIDKNASKSFSMDGYTMMNMNMGGGK